MSKSIREACADIDARVRRTEIDGVTTFWAADAPRVVGSLQFRAGRSDEPFPKMGLSHLVEHLALYSLRDRPCPHNGFVDHFRTAFLAWGSTDEVVAFVTDAAQNLHQLPTTRLREEMRVLRSEANGRSGQVPAQLLWLRCGATGYGNLGEWEHGLHTITAAELRAWATSRYTAGNAVATLSSEPPTTLRFALPAGSRFEPIGPEPINPLPLPCWAPRALPGIALGALVPRTSASTVAMHNLTKRLEQRLRYTLAKSYEVSLAYMPLTSRIGNVSIFATCLEPDVAGVMDAFIEVCRTFAEQGPTDDELRDELAVFGRSMTDPDAILGALDRSAANCLLGGPEYSMSELLDEIEGLSRTAVRDAAAEALRGAIYAGPVTHPPMGLGIGSYPAASTDVVGGRRFGTTRKKYPWSKAPTLVVGDQGVSFVDLDQRPTTVRFEDCVGVLAETGRRMLFGRDGFAVRVDAAEWYYGTAAISQIDKHVPADRFVYPANPND